MQACKICSETSKSKSHHTDFEGFFFEFFVFSRCEGQSFCGLEVPEGLWRYGEGPKSGWNRVYSCRWIPRIALCLLSLCTTYKRYNLFTKFTCFFFYFWTFEKRRVHFQTLRFHENSLHDQGRGLQPDQGAKAMSCDVKPQLLMWFDLIWFMTDC